MYYQKDKLSEELLGDIWLIARKQREGLPRSFVLDEKGLVNWLTLDGLTIEFKLEVITPFNETTENIKKKLFNKWSRRVFEGKNNYYRFGDNINDYYVNNSGTQLIVKVPFQAIEYYNYFDTIPFNLIIEILLKINDVVKFVRFDKSLPGNLNKEELYKEAAKKILPISFGLYQSIVSDIYPEVNNIWYEVIRSMMKLSNDQKKFIDNLPHDKEVGESHINLRLYSDTFMNLLAATYIKQNYPRIYLKLLKLLNSSEWVESLREIGDAPKVIRTYLTTGNLGDFVYQHKKFYGALFPYLYMLIFNEPGFKYDKNNDLTDVLYDISDYVTRKNRSGTEEDIIKDIFDIIRRLNLNKDRITLSLNMIKEDLISGKTQEYEELITALKRLVQI